MCARVCVWGAVCVCVFVVGDDPDGEVKHIVAVVLGVVDEPP